VQPSIYAVRDGGGGDPSVLNAERPLALVAVIEARLSTSLDRALTADGYRVTRTANAFDVSEVPFAPDVVLLDGPPPLVQQLRAITDAPILVVSTEDSAEARIATLDAGADEVVAIPFEPRELLARLRALRRGRELAVKRARHGTLSYADIHLDLDTREVTRGGRKVDLRYKGVELLACFMRHPERVLSRRELLEDVWGYDFLGDSNVIEVTVSHLRQALEAGGERRLIFTVRPIGYILNARPEARYSCKGK
jgi:two-component system, OmpR family, response regulator MprA